VTVEGLEVVGGPGCGGKQGLEVAVRSGGRNKVWRQRQGLKAAVKRRGEVLPPAVYPPSACHPPLARCVSPCAIHVCAINVSTIKAGAGSLQTLRSG
jgi:hypothetical protein